jgi:uncharacterized Ntn-hydrolase superfamily protein
MNPLVPALFALALATPGGAPQPLAHTFSIVARDSVTGEIGVAVQSHYFSVGPTVPWAEAGVGAVATQSLVRVEYGPEGLALMRAGLSAPQALDSLLRADPNAAVRQVAMIDARGRVAAHTGAGCIPDAGDIVGAQYSVQANLMADPGVWPAMSRAYERAKGDLADRLLAALDAAQAAGGDIRGRQSAAIVVVRAASTGKPWADRLFDLRVEDHPQPLQELRRLVRLRRAYLREDAGDEFIAAHMPDSALAAYADAARLAPDVVELRFWAAVSMYTSGREAEARKVFRAVFAAEPRWVDLVPRLARVGMFPDDPKKIDDVVRLRPRASRAR